MDPLFLLLHYLLKAGKEVSFPWRVSEGEHRDTASLFQGALQLLEQVPFPPWRSSTLMVIKSDQVTVTSVA